MNAFSGGPGPAAVVLSALALASCGSFGGSQEFWLKGSPGGKNFIGPHGDAGGTDDREIMSFDGRVMVLRFVDVDVAGRFGTGVYVRCAPRA
jgi:hypothetical protein